MKSQSVASEELRRSIAATGAPIVIDVRRRPAFFSSDSLVSGALRRDPETVDAWSASLPKASVVVVYCVHGHEVSQRTASALNERGIAARYLEGGFEAWEHAGGALDRKPRNGSTRWVTRERPKIDRIACPWLITRFIDPTAEFLYVPAKSVLETAREKDAVPYDIPGVHFSHQGEQCSFDAFLRHFRLTDPALQDLAVIVRGADTARLDLAPQAAGLAAISLGLSRNFEDDYEMLEHGIVTYDALYT